MSDVQTLLDILGFVEQCRCCIVCLCAVSDNAEYRPRLPGVSGGSQDALVQSVSCSQIHDRTADCQEENGKMCVLL